MPEHNLDEICDARPEFKTMNNINSNHRDIKMIPPRMSTKTSHSKTPSWDPILVHQEFSEENSIEWASKVSYINNHNLNIDLKMNFHDGYQRGDYIHK